MKYQKTILNVSSLLFIVFAIIYTIFDYRTLSADEGWGVIAMITYVVGALIALIIDFALRKTIKNKVTLNVIGGIVLLFFLLLLLMPFLG